MGSKPEFVQELSQSGPSTASRCYDDGVEG